MTRTIDSIIIYLAIQSIYIFENVSCNGRIHIKAERGIAERKQGGDRLKQKYEQQMKKGVLEMLVLQLLSEKEKYGYQLICELKEKSADMFLLKEGTLYPILYRMEDDSLVVSRWSEPKGKEVSKKYYRITAEGEETLLRLRELWETFSRAVGDIMYGPGKTFSEAKMVSEDLGTAGA